MLQGDQGLVLPKDDMSHAFYRIRKQEFPLSNQQLSTRLHVVSWNWTFLSISFCAMLLSPQLETVDWLPYKRGKRKWAEKVLWHTTKGWRVLGWDSLIKPKVSVFHTLSLWHPLDNYTYNDTRKVWSFLNFLMGFVSCLPFFVCLLCWTVGDGLRKWKKLKCFSNSFLWNGAHLTAKILLMQWSLVLLVI